MYKISVIGDKESVLGFMAVGFSVYIAPDAVTAAQVLRRIAGENNAIIFITEDLAMQISEDIARYKDSVMPAVIAIPGKHGATGYGMDNIRRSVERAVGADILFKDE